MALAAGAVAAADAEVATEAVDGVGVLDTGVEVGRLAGCAPLHADKIKAALKVTAAITR